MKNLTRPTLSSKAYKNLRLLLPDITEDATHVTIYEKWYRGESAGNVTKEIPLDYNSKHFLCWLGFTEDTARVMYDEWLEKPKDEESPALGEECHRSISEREVQYGDVTSAHYRWDHAMWKLGISIDLVKELRKEENYLGLQPMHQAHNKISQWLERRILNRARELRSISRALENLPEDLPGDKWEQALED